MKKTKEILTAEDLPAINRILCRGDQVVLIPVKDGKRGYRIKREEIDFSIPLESKN